MKKRTKNESVDEPRRRLLQAALAMPGVVLLGCGASATSPTPACDDGDDDPTGIYSSRLLMAVEDSGSGRNGTFNFVLNV